MNSAIRMAVQALLAVAVLAGCSKDKPEALIASAKQSLQKKDDKTAVIQLKNALQAKPDSQEARFLLGQALLQGGNPIAAEVELRKAMELKYPIDDVAPLLARALAAQSQYKKLIDEFASIHLAEAAQEADLQTTLAGAYAESGDLPRASASVASALAAHPDYAPARVAAAGLKAHAKDFDGAIAILDAVIKQSPASFEAFKLKGDVLQYGSQRWPEAAAAYRQSIAINPQYLPAQFALVDSLLRQNDVAGAAKQQAVVKTLAPKNLYVKFLDAQIGYHQANYVQANEAAQSLMQQLPDNAQVLQLTGAVEFQMQSLVRAEAHLSKALQLDPRLSIARQTLMRLYLKTGRPQKALEALTALGPVDKLPVDMLAVGGEVYLQNGAFDRAEEAFRRAAKINPVDPNARTSLALTHLASGNSSGAFGELQMIAAEDKGITADLAMISAHLNRKENAAALAAISALEKKQPDQALPPTLRGRVQMSMGQRAAARASFEQALKLDPDAYPAIASLASLDVGDGKPADAKKRFDAVLTKDPRHKEATVALAELAVRTGAKKEDIAALLNRAVALDPSDVAPRLLLIELYVRSSDNKQAMAAAQAANAALPDNPKVLDALGRVLQMSGDLNQAVSTYKRLTGLLPDVPEGYVRLADVYMTAKDWPAAEQTLRKSLDVRPDFLPAQRGLIAIGLETKDADKISAVVADVKKQRPTESTGFAIEGDVAATRQDWDASAAAYRGGLKRAESPELAIKLHSVLVAGKHPREAEAFEAEWTRAHPADPVFFSYLGDRALERRDMASAERSYQIVVKAQPNNAVVFNNLAWTTFQLKKPGALAYAEKANALAPGHAVFMDTWAMLLADKKDYANAIRLQKRALALEAKNNNFRLNLARMYVQSGNRALAKRELEVLAKLGPEYSGQAEVNTLLKGL